jgi:hypothetical protein
VKLPRQIVQHGGPRQDVGAKITLRIEEGVSQFEIETALEIVETDVQTLGQDIVVDKGQLPRAFFEAIREGIASEMARRIAENQVVPPLKVTIEAVVIHPIDARIDAHRDAGAKAVARLFDE